MNFPPLEKWRTHEYATYKTTGYYDEDGWFVAPGHRSCGQSVAPEKARAATQDEMDEAIATIKRYADNARVRRENNAVLLAKAGLAEGDFCRFRNVTEDGNNIVVETRENGVDGFSLEAVKKSGDRLVSRENDEGDSTYAYYTIRKLDGAS